MSSRTQRVLYPLYPRLTTSATRAYARASDATHPLVSKPRCTSESPTTSTTGRRYAPRAVPAAAAAANAATRDGSPGPVPPDPGNRPWYTRDAYASSRSPAVADPENAARVVYATNARKNKPRTPRRTRRFHDRPPLSAPAPPRPRSARNIACGARARPPPCLETAVVSFKNARARAVRVARAFIEKKTRIGFKPELASRGFDRRGEKRLWSGIGQERSPPKRFSCARNLCFGGRAPIARPKLRVNLVPFSLSSDYYTRTKDQMSLHFRFFRAADRQPSTPSHLARRKMPKPSLNQEPACFPPRQPTRVPSPRDS